MTIIDRAPLGASTTNRKRFYDVRRPGDAEWTGLFGIGEAKHKPAEATTQDDSDFDGGGYKSSTVTALTHGVELKLHRKTQESDPTAYDPGQEILREAAMRMGIGNRVEYRYYEMEEGGPRVEAYQGFASVTWTPDGGDMTATDTVAAVLQGQGRLVPIAHPQGVTVTSTIYTISPTPGPLTASQVVLRGAGFPSGTPAVTFDGTAATAVTRLDANTIVATMPVKNAAGIAIVKVATGPEFAYKRA